MGEKAKLEALISHAESLIGTLRAAISTIADAPKKKLVRVYAILDASGSMAGLQEDTIAGFNGFIDKQRANESTDVEVSLTVFQGNDNVRLYNYTPSQSVVVRYANRPIAEVKPLTKSEYRPGGGTPLLDAVGTTLQNAQLAGEPAGREVANIVLIITDGEENTSTQFKREGIANLIKAFEAKGNWTFAYIGSDVSTWTEAESLNVKRGNVFTYTADSAGINLSYASVSDSISTYRSGFATESLGSSTANLANLNTTAGGVGATSTVTVKTDVPSTPTAAANETPIIKSTETP